MKMFKRNLVASSIIASLYVAPAALADDIQVKISNSLLDTYTDKYEEADLVVMKLSDIRVAAMAYWAENEAYPGVINDLVADSYYFGTFTTTFGSVINGVNNTNSYAITIDLPTPELASYVASNVNGNFSGNTVTLEFGLPMSAIANNVSLSRFDDPTNPDLNRMSADINMDGNDINNVGNMNVSNLTTDSLVANGATVNGDFVVNSGGNSLEMNASGLTYNGAALVTEDNIATYADTSDLVSKTEDAVMNGAYTIEGVGSSLNIGENARINFTQSDAGSYIDATRRGVAIGYGGNPLLEIGDGAFGTGLSFNPTYTSSVVSLNAKRGGFKSKLYLNNRAVLKSAGGETWIGADDGRIVSNDGASLSTNIAAADGGQVNLIVGQSGYLTPDYALVAGNDVDGNAYTSLMYNSEDRLSTNRDGVNINGAITANGSGGNYFNLSESLFTYQGNDVLTAGNFMNYAASSEDAVSKTQDGTLRGRYTIDGLEEDGVTPSNAGFQFRNDSFVNFTNDVNSITMRQNDNGNLVFTTFDSNHSNRGALNRIAVSGSRYGGVNLYYNDGQNPILATHNEGIFVGTNQGKQIFKVGDGTWGHGLEYFNGGIVDLSSASSRLRLNSQAAALYNSNGTTYIGQADHRFTAHGGGSENVVIRADRSGKVSIGLRSEQIAVKSEGAFNNYVTLNYEDKQVFRTVTDGSLFSGNVKAQYDSDADGIADTEYFNLSESAFTYNGADVITAANIGTYAATAEDAVSKTQDGTLRGLYTINGLEDDGTTPSDAGLRFRNGADLNLANGSSIDIRANEGNASSRVLNIGGTSDRPAAFILYNQSGAFRNQHETWFQSGSATNNGYTIGMRSTNNGSKIVLDNDTNSNDGGIFLISRRAGVKIQVAEPHRRKTVLQTGYKDLRHNISLLNDSSTRYRTAEFGSEMFGNVKVRALGASEDYLSLSDTEFVYNGADVITSANIGTYAATVEDVVSKTQDGTLRGLYTIDGLEDDGVTPSGAGLNFINDSIISVNGTKALSFMPNASGFYNSSTTIVNGVLSAQGHQNETFFSVGDGFGSTGFTYTAKQVGDTAVELKSTTNQFSSTLGQTFGYLALDINGGGNVVLKHTGGSVNIGASDSRFNSFGGGSSAVNLYASDKIDLRLGRRGRDGSFSVLKAIRDDLSRASVVLLNQDSEKARTTNDGMLFSGHLTAQYDSDFDGIADTEYFNLSETAFTYNGAEVITAANIATYAATVEDVVSKTQDGTLRGLYTIDGLEEDGVTPSGAGLRFINDAFIDGNLLVKSGNNELANINASNITLATRFSGSDTGIFLNSVNSIGLDRLILSRNNAKLYSQGGNTFIGTADKRINASGMEASSNVYIGASNEVLIGVQNSGVRTDNTILRAYSDISGMSVVDLQYEAQKRLSTNSSGIDIAGNFIASYDSNADGLADTEYFNLSESAFTYNGAEVITAANIGTYAATAEDVVSRTQDGTLRGLYTIDGLEDDGVTPSGAGLVMNNGSTIELRNGSKISGRDVNIQANRYNRSFVENNGFLSELYLEFGQAYMYGNEFTTVGIRKGVERTVTPRVDIYARDAVTIFGNTTRTKSQAFEANFINGKGSVELMYDGQTQLKTTQNGLSLLSNLTAQFDSDADGIADTEYFNLSESAFTYNGAEVITAANVNSYIDTSDFVSKSQNSVMEAQYAIVGAKLENGVPVQTGARLDIVNGAILSVTNGPTGFQVGDGRMISVQDSVVLRGIGQGVSITSTDAIISMNNGQMSQRAPESFYTAANVASFGLSDEFGGINTEFIRTDITATTISHRDRVDVISERFSAGSPDASRFIRVTAQDIAFLHNDQIYMESNGGRISLDVDEALIYGDTSSVTSLNKATLALGTLSDENVIIGSNFVTITPQSTQINHDANIALNAPQIGITGGTVTLSGTSNVITDGFTSTLTVNNGISIDVAGSGLQIDGSVLNSYTEESNLYAEEFMLLGAQNQQISLNENGFTLSSDSNSDGLMDKSILNIKQDTFGNTLLVANNDELNALVFDNTSQVWATNADFQVANLDATTINAGLITADEVTVNTRLTVEGIDVGQWIKDCEAGVSSGCSL